MLAKPCAFLSTKRGGAGQTGLILNRRVEGRARNVFGGRGVGTFNVIYRGSVCGPNLKADRDFDADGNAH
jgi:hypothetical protein